MARFSIDGGEGTSNNTKRKSSKRFRRKSSKRRRRRSPSQSLRIIQTQLLQEEDDKEIEDEEEVLTLTEEEETEESESESERENGEERDVDSLAEIVTGDSPPPSLPQPVRRSGTASSITLTDPEAFDCNICMEPLSIPVFQCDNGHIACSSCCKNLAHRCASCSLPIGYNRCRAIEKVLESILVSCENMQYGCQETIIYSKKREHEKNCVYVPCLCPVIGCNFSGSYKQIYQHSTSKHSSSVIRFDYDCTIPVFFTRNDTCLILQEEKDGVLFILHNRVEALGNVVTISCLQPLSSKTKYFYELIAKTDGSSLRFQSFTTNIASKFDKPSSAGFLLIPENFFGTYGQLTLDLCISCISHYDSQLLTN